MFEPIDERKGNSDIKEKLARYFPFGTHKLPVVKIP
jgi:hypothetical protein